MPQRPVVLVSNRGPLSFSFDDAGDLQVRRGGGGLVSGIAPLVAGTDALWVAAAPTDADRAAAREGVTEADGLRVALVDVDPDRYRQAYDTVCNTTIWFCSHGLFDAARTPVIDDEWYEAWEAYRAYNESFIDAVAELAPPGAAVLVQDYHLALCAGLRQRRPDTSVVWFSHTPWVGPEGWKPMPDHASAELLAGLGDYDACSFHVPRWAAAYQRCYPGGPPNRVGVASLGPDPDDLAAAAGSVNAASAAAALTERLAGRKALVRVDRMELSKNILRGFDAFASLLEHEPRWREQVTFLALCYPSRQSVPAYAAYAADVVARAEAINDRFATGDWTPILLETDDDFPRSMAALSLADAVLVNPVRDGMNLVAKEQALVSRNNAALVLSTEAGAWDELGSEGALGVNPFDVRDTARAIRAALEMEPTERARRHDAMRAATLARTPRHWLADQLRLAGPPA